MIKIKTKKEEFELFDKYSNKWWDEEGEFKVLHKIRPIRMRYIIDQIGTNNLTNKDILDIGCGGGLVTEPLTKLGGNVTGIDFVKSNIEIAKKHSKIQNLEINYICGDVEKTKFKKKFDIIVLFEVLEHLDNWKKFISNIKKNIKPNGKVIISTINRNLISKHLTITLGENIFGLIPRGTHDHNKYIKPEEIKEFALKEKIEFTNLKGLIFNPLENNWILSKITTVNYFCTLNFN
tara:strand:+ start:444 stop:1148 length:705 start_codon:yes stop_codon:yes gene_type:complete